MAFTHVIQYVPQPASSDKSRLRAQSPSRQLPAQNQKASLDTRQHRFFRDVQETAAGANFHKLVAYKHRRNSIAAELEWDAAGEDAKLNKNSTFRETSFIASVSRKILLMTT